MVTSRSFVVELLTINGLLFRLAGLNGIQVSLGLKVGKKVIVCRDDQGRIRFQFRKSIGNCHILMAETLAIREAVMETIKTKLQKVIIEAIPKLLFRQLQWRSSPLAISPILLRYSCPGFCGNEY